MDHYSVIAKQILLGSTLEDKLISSNQINFTNINSEISLPLNPGRNQGLKFNNEQVKFPRGQSFHLEEKRGLALHFFANHELLAIEMMAAAMLIYPDSTPEMLNFKKGLFKTIQDEQKHLKLYLKRMNDFGIRLGDFPLNDFFWRSMGNCKTPSMFYSAMALTFESANLDFALYYEKIFREVEDFDSAKIMKVVFEDEISHVALGAYWLNQWKGDQKLWDYYKNNLPGVMTPARAKGIHSSKNNRLKTGLDEEFLEELFAFRDEFKVTNRKSWS